LLKIKGLGLPGPFLYIYSMKKEKLLILERKDLIHSSINKKIDDIDIRDLRLLAYSNILTSNFVVFIDENGKNKILKNRYGI